MGVVFIKLVLTGFVQILYNEIPVLSRTFQALFFFFSKDCNQKSHISNIYFTYLKLIFIKATYVIQEQRLSLFLLFFD